MSSLVASLKRKIQTRDRRGKEGRRKKETSEGGAMKQTKGNQKDGVNSLWHYFTPFIARLGVASKSVSSVSVITATFIVNSKPSGLLIIFPPRENCYYAGCSFMQRN